MVEIEEVKQTIVLRWVSFVPICTHFGGEVSREETGKHPMHLPKIEALSIYELPAFSAVMETFYEQTIEVHNIVKDRTITKEIQDYVALSGQAFGFVNNCAF